MLRANPVPEWPTIQGWTGCHGSAQVGTGSHLEPWGLTACISPDDGTDDPRAVQIRYDISAPDKTICPLNRGVLTISAPDIRVGDLIRVQVPVHACLRMHALCYLKVH